MNEANESSANTESAETGKESGSSLDEDIAADYERLMTLSIDKSDSKSTH